MVDGGEKVTIAVAHSSGHLANEHQIFGWPEEIAFDRICFEIKAFPELMTAFLIGKRSVDSGVRGY